ncbi:type I restriction enzyme HsdR N-terminal domain-containing protein [Mesorhizobium sp. M0179]|uniref:type I restriction enzyme HsdR N-terminal domain-containing protein n=1 Tax=Mesorhizobium sp. M0179 TaxID=2956905 RepID=UPI00333D2B83
MHINHDNLVLNSEGDVEAKLLIPLLSSELYLGIPAQNFFSKEYLAPTEIDKGAKVPGGYYPDFSVWIHGFPILLVEAKTPGVPVEQAYREASLYARHLNSQRPTGLNPASFIVASSGTRVLFGRWDAPPEFDVHYKLLRPGSTTLQEVQQVYGFPALRQHALECLRKVKTNRGRRPFNNAGGPAIINAKKALNSFAADLSPILRRYFTSRDASDIKEISKYAYVSSAEVTEYDRVLESLLKDRVQVRRDTIVERLEPDGSSEKHIEKAFAVFDEERPAAGQLQIIQGAVGAGKSLFIRRYKEVLQSPGLMTRCRWAWVDFGSGSFDLSNAQVWLAKAFNESFQAENPEIDFGKREVLWGIFAKQVQRRKPIYDDVAAWDETKAAILRNEDLQKWQDDPIEYSIGLANYILGQRQELLLVVMDNVDRLDLKTQLDVFQLALWFMGQTKAFTILQMRDETYERFKTKPPLDTFRAGIAFHITPPRFIDVVRKRLDLSLRYLADRAETTQSYTLPSGARITVPTNELGRFLQDLYVELFERRRNIARIMESLAGKDVRRALDMFVSIITSGHLGEDQITSQVRGGGELRITEHNLLKILMRTDYQLFSDRSGFISNIFSFENEWNRPSNFLLIEILFFLASSRKRSGQIGIEGYFAVQHICELMQKRGYDTEDTAKAVNLALTWNLIDADHMGNISAILSDSVKISASGFIHLRTLVERLEYLYGILATTRVTDGKVLSTIAEATERELRLGDLSARAKLQVVEAFRGYLLKQATALAKAAGSQFDIADRNSGAAYVLRAMERAISRFYTQDDGKKAEVDLLD